MRRDRQLAYRLVALQFALCLLMAGLAALYDSAAALAALIGGLSSAAANSFFVWMVLKPTIAAPAAGVVRSFYIGAAGKFIIVVLSLAVAFRFVDPFAEGRNALVLFAAFMVVQCAYWAAPVLDRNSNRATR